MFSLNGLVYAAFSYSYSSSFHLTLVQIDGLADTPFSGPRRDFGIPLPNGYDFAQNDQYSELHFAVGSLLDRLSFDYGTRSYFFIRGNPFIYEQNAITGLWIHTPKIEQLSAEHYSLLALSSGKSDSVHAQVTLASYSDGASDSSRSFVLSGPPSGFAVGKDYLYIIYTATLNVGTYALGAWFEYRSTLLRIGDGAEHYTFASKSAIEGILFDQSDRPKMVFPRDGNGTGSRNFYFVEA